jgi:DNA-binding CsgD family transcriptional regulator
MKTDAQSIIFSLYDAVGREDAWSNIVKMLCEYLDTNIGFFVFIGQGQYEQDFYATHNFSETCAKEYSEYWWQHNIWLTTGTEKGLFVKGAILIGTEHVSTAELKRTAFYRDFLVTMPAEHLMTATMLESSNAFETPPMTLNFFRPPGDAAFNQADADALRLLYPHIQRAFSLHWEWRSMREQLVTYHASLDSMDFGVMFINPARRVQHANRTAKSLAADIMLNGLPTTGAVAQCIDAAAKGEGGAAVFGKARTMLLTLPVSAPVRNTAGETRASVMLILVDPEKRPDAAAEFVSNAFTLSKAEARLIPLLLQGKTPAEIAQTLKLKLPTVRSQLSNIFAKTGTTRQQELIRLLGALPGVVEINPA